MVPLEGELNNNLQCHIFLMFLSLYAVLVSPATLQVVETLTPPKSITNKTNGI